MVDKSLQPILTLNSRDHLGLEIAREHFRLTTAQLGAGIQAMHQLTIQVLAAKGIEYKKLGSALVPRLNGSEAGFIFDSTAVASSWYALQIMREVLPLLEPRTTQSVLCGDLLGKDQPLIFEILRESMVLARSFVFGHANSLFCVYLNNLSDTAVQRLHQRLVAFPPYLGYIPATFGSGAKIYLSTTLANSFLKNKNRIIIGHEDDRVNEENVNVKGYPFEEFGYKVFSLQSKYFGMFLSFKIERPLYKSFEVDSEMALNAIADQVHPLTDFTVVLEERKHRHLLAEKLGKLQKARLAGLDHHQLASLIKSKVAANYIYNMEYLSEHDVMKFVLMLEVEREDGGYPTRLLAVLKYKPKDKVLQVITLY